MKSVEVIYKSLATFYIKKYFGLYNCHALKYYFNLLKSMSSFLSLTSISILLLATKFYCSLFLYLSISLSNYLSVHIIPSIYLSDSISLFLSLPLSLLFSLIISLSQYLLLCLSIFLSLSLVYLVSMQHQIFKFDFYHSILLGSHKQ